MLGFVVVDINKYGDGLWFVGDVNEVFEHLSMDEIVVNVEFEKDNAAELQRNDVQVVSAEISWEDFELMVGHFLNFHYVI